MAIAFCLLINDKRRNWTFHFSSRLKLHFKESKAIHKKSARVKMTWSDGAKLQ